MAAGIDLSTNYSGRWTYIVGAGVEVACHIRQTSVEPGIVAYPSQGYQVRGYGASSEWGGFLRIAAYLVGARRCDPHRLESV